MKDPKKRIGDEPIEKRFEKLLNALARGIDEAINGDLEKPDRHNGFVLMVFPLEGHEGRCNYISNGKREDIVTLFKAQIKRFEGQPDVSGHA